MFQRVSEKRKEPWMYWRGVRAGEGCVQGVKREKALKRVCHSERTVLEGVGEGTSIRNHPREERDHQMLWFWVWG